MEWPPAVDTTTPAAVTQPAPVSRHRHHRDVQENSRRGDAREENVEERGGDVAGRGRHHHRHGSVLLQLRGHRGVRLLRGRPVFVLFAAVRPADQFGVRLRRPAQPGPIRFDGTARVQAVRRVQNSRLPTPIRRRGEYLHNLFCFFFLVYYISYFLDDFIRTTIIIRIMYRVATG